MTPDYGRYRHIAVVRENGIATLTLNEPNNRNAIHAEMHAELERVWLDLVDVVSARLARADRGLHGLHLVNIKEPTSS